MDVADIYAGLGAGVFKRSAEKGGEKINMSMNRKMIVHFSK